MFGVSTAPSAVTEVLKRNYLTGSDIAFTAHQSSSVLLDAWIKVIQPAQFVNTIGIFGNTTGAAIPINLAWAPVGNPITQNYLVCMALGPEAHFDALLLKRDPVT